MAKERSNFSIFFNLALVLTLLLMIVTMAQSKPFLGGSKVLCESVVGVDAGDTCFGIADTFNVTTTTFEALNPNLNCTALFIGQWVCIDGFIT